MVTAASENHKSFAAYSLPGETVWHYIEYENGMGLNRIDDLNSFNGFCFNLFGVKSEFEAYGLSIDSNYGGELSQTKLNMPSKSSPKDVYLKNVATVIKNQDNECEKTVFSRNKTFFLNKLPFDSLARYFDKFPLCFRYVFNSSTTGLWFGASPEVLIKYDLTSGDVSTMSLAGTKKIDDTCERWDNKNTLEHNIVTEYITDVLKKHGITVTENCDCELEFGNIKHLCNKIQGNGSFNVSELLIDLEPTPALCGFPREKSMKLISELEDYNRNCFGGFVGIRNSDKIYLFVNIRCGSVDVNKTPRGYKYNLYAGGGLTSKSRPEDEWEETENKMQSLFNCLNEN